MGGVSGTGNGGGKVWAQITEKGQGGKGKEMEDGVPEPHPGDIEQKQLEREIMVPIPRHSSWARDFVKNRGAR